MLPLRVLKGNRLLLACNRWISGYIGRDQWLEDVVDLNSKRREKLFPRNHRARDLEGMNPLLIEADQDLPIAFGEISQFSQFRDLDKRLLKNIELLGFVEMTPVQRYTIPALLSELDVLACAETGSGKTHAFLVPMVHSIISKYPEEMMQHLRENNAKYQCPLGLILTPSNALALQIQNECEKLLFGTRTQVISTGSTDISQTVKRLADGCHILVGTPSRVIELVQRSYLNLQFCRHLVIDEVDSFTDVNGILGSYLRMLVSAPQLGLPDSANRRTLLCSATISRSDETICREILSSNYLKLSPDPEFGKPVPSSISQSFIWTGSANDDEKMDLLIDLLNKLGNEDKILIYCKYNKCKMLEKALMQNGFVPSTIVKGFLSTRSELGTDVKDRNIIISSLSSAFGLDFSGVRYVVIMDLPRDISTYVHQIGRGGRMGESAHAVSFFGEQDLKLADDLMILLESCGSPIPEFLSQLYVNEEL